MRSALRVLSVAGLIALVPFAGSCAFVGQIPMPGGIGLELIAEGFVSPVALVDPADETGRFLIADQVGMVWAIDPEGLHPPSVFLDLRDRVVPLRARYDERGLLGLALHPEYPDDGRIYVYYSAPLRGSAPVGWDHTGRVSEFRRSELDAVRADADSERVILEVDQPQSNHNGGGIAFGPDGHLYVALGDGGGANDVGIGHPEQGNGQDRGTLLGSILRLDVEGSPDRGGAYAIPFDNPFVDGPGRAEIFAYGFRNPFRMSFDRGGDRALYVGDVGQDLREEVNLVVSGGNYGWRLREGTLCFDPARPVTPPAECADRAPSGEPLADPLIDYAHPPASGGFGISVIGGYVYRGSRIPLLQGLYVFADWSRGFSRGDGTLLAAVPAHSGQGAWEVHELAIAPSASGRIGAFILSLGQDSDGELYVLTTGTPGLTGTGGRVYRLAPASNDSS